MDSLYKLIKSMNKSEKRHFKLFANSFGKKENLYLQLFDAIDKEGEDLDESDLVKELNIKHLSVTKRYLFDTILKSLRNYHVDHNIAFRILGNIQNISLLRNRGMIKEAIKVYEKTYEELLDQNLYTFLLELLNTAEVLWAAYLPNKEMLDKLAEIQQEKLLYIDYLNSITTYRALARNLKNTVRVLFPLRDESQEADVKALLNNPLLQNVDNASNLLAKSLYYECKNICLSALLDYEGVKQSTQEAIGLLEQQERKSVVLYKTLIANLVNGLLAAARSKDEETFQLLAIKYRTLQNELTKKIGNSFDCLLQKLYYNFTLHYLIAQDRFDEVIALEPEISAFWRNNDDFLETDWKMTMSFFFAQSLFYKKDYDKAQQWIDIILEEEKNNPKVSCVCNARIMNLMIHYEKGNFMLLYSLFRSTYRYLNKNERNYKIERALLNFFKWVGENEYTPKMEEKLEKLNNDLNKLKTNKYEKKFFDEMKLHLWLAGKKLGNTPLEEEKETMRGA